MATKPAMSVTCAVSTDDPTASPPWAGLFCGAPAPYRWEAGAPESRKTMSNKGMSVEEAKAYLAKRGLESLVPGGFKTISAMQQGGSSKGKKPTKRKP